MFGKKTTIEEFKQIAEDIRKKQNIDLNNQAVITRLDLKKN